MIKIGYLSLRPLEDKLVWSGINYYLYKNLLKIDDVEVVWIPYTVKRDTPLKYRLLLKIIAKVRKKGYALAKYVPAIAKQTAKDLDKDLLNKVDILFAPCALCGYSYIKTDKPVVYIADATFMNLYNYYEGWENYTKISFNQANALEKAGLEKAWKVIAASDWAKASMVNDYKINPDKIHVLEFGANIDNILPNKNTYDKTGVLNLLFLGMDWARKGGAVAVKAAETLNKMGVETKLHIVGVDAPEGYSDTEYMKFYGLLKKSDAQEYEKLKSIITSSHIFLMPTNAECAGIVFCEASGYGLPIFTYDTGGVPNYVINGQNGYRLPLSASGEDFAIKIKECIDNNELPALSDRGVSIYKERLNWDVWMEKFKGILSEYKEGK